MSDQPLTRAVFEAFQRRLFDTLEARFAGVHVNFEKTDVRFDEVAGQIGGVEKRLDDVVAGEPRYALRADVQDLKARIDGLQAGIDDLLKRADSA